MAADERRRDVECHWYLVVKELFTHRCVEARMKSINLSRDKVRCVVATQILEPTTFFHRHTVRSHSGFLAQGWNQGPRWDADRDQEHAGRAAATGLEYTLRCEYRPGVDFTSQHTWTMPSRTNLHGRNKVRGACGSCHNL